MQKRISNLLFSIAIIGFLTACNTDDPTGDAGPPTPSFVISGQIVDPITGETSAWTTNEVISEFDSQGLKLKAVVGSDTLFLAIPGIAPGMYLIESSEPLGSLNKYEAVAPGDSTATLYTFKADGSGGGLFTILSNDSTNQTITGEFNVIFYNPINNSDFIELNNVNLSNLSYAPESGGPVFTPGTGEIAFTRDGEDFLFDETLGYIDTVWNVIRIQGVSEKSPIAPPDMSITLTFATDIDTGVYVLDGTTVQTAAVIDGFINSYLADSGEVHVTMHDTVNNDISGTFFFKGFGDTNDDSTIVTNGSFEMNYLNSL